MQRSSTRFIGSIWQRQSMPYLLVMHKMQLSRINRRHLAGYGGSGKAPTNIKTPTSSGTKKTGTMQHSSASESSFDRRGPRLVMREDNMWRDPQRLDTKWLSPRDPTRYKPDFGQTEPHSLRKQFMRSPDERTRDAMGREWEVAMRTEGNRRRQAFLAKQQREQELLEKQLEQQEARRPEARLTGRQRKQSSAEDRKNNDKEDNKD